ncbi:MAG: peptidase dimerization domain-containing protein, partial [Clostridia bacterium]|nr:peptidase dimerization domain-containing protein [Clostridia bacterium]
MEHRLNAVEKHRNLILDTLDYIWKNPETGYREVKTSAYMEKVFRDLGYELTMAGDIPGFYTVLDTGRPGPELLILGELDSLICFDHPDADPKTGAVHCCGHAAQCAGLVGIAAALKEPGVLDGLSGRIRLCAVPAEELIEIDYRTQLKKAGKIKYFGGKPEFLHRGYFDGVDLAFMVHTTSGESFAVNRGGVGCLAKKIIYKGKASHAGGAPEQGCNALYAATQGLSAINAIRETFREPDMIRVHPIITKGGNAVNAIPDEVIIESYVRGNSFEAIEKTNKKVNRALIG